MGSMHGIRGHNSRVAPKKAPVDKQKPAAKKKTVKKAKKGE